MVLAAKALVLSAILAVISCGPVDVRLTSEDKCYTTCTESNKFNYLPGRTYRFQYEGETVTTTQSNEHSSLHFRATADIEAISKCEMALTLSDVTVEESDPRDLARRFRSEGEAALKEALESSALRFSFQDGQIAELCPEREESQMALNIKRGILSAFQNNMESLERDHSGSETDVAGNCPADYTVTENSWEKIVVKKSKNLVGCTDRHNYGNTFHGVAYSVDSDIQSLPLMKSTHDCEQTLHKQGRLLASKCQESHVFRPFNDEKTSSNTTTSQSLTFVKEHNGPRTRGPITRRTNMLFEHADETEENNKDFSAAQSKLREICQATSSDVRPETPRLFTELVYIMRKLNNFGLKNLQKIATNGKPCQQARKYFFDALPMAGSSASIKLMKTLLITGEVTGLEADAWLTVMAFVQNPTQEMIDELQDIVSSPKTSKKAMLSVSTMIYNFCKNNGNCKSNGAVREVIRVFEENLNGDCRFNNAEEREKVILSLRALGNAGQSVNAISLLNRCAMGRNSMDIRVAAIDAFRRMDCSEGRTELMNLFKNTEEDSELRIGAYLAVIQCPTVDIIEEVKTVLESEEINQVGSFVWTHLTNLMETSDPQKQNIRAILEDATLKKEFDMDKRKFSRNIELSFFSEMLNTGAKADSNLIWSTKSWIPRSAMLNMTVDLFGTQMNLLEIGGRVEGMDYLLESLFGNNGYFPEMADNIRSKRSARDGMLNRFKQSFQLEDASEPKASMFMRIFGNEMAFMDMTNYKGAMGDFNFLDILIKLAENHKVDFTKSVVFMDVHYKIPTIIGMPLGLDINGTATVDMKIGGKMDLRQLGSSPRSVDIDGYMQPSTAVEISSAMYMDCGVAKTGVASVSTMHSSADVEGTISLKNGEVFVTKFNMPKDKIDILSVDNKFFVFRKSIPVEQKMAEQKVEASKCTGDMIAKVTGLELCGALSYTSTAPITGPSSVKVSLNKRDTHTGYEFTTTFMAKKESKAGKRAVTNIASVAFNTPGSKVDREMSVNFQLNRGEKTINLDMTSPWKKVSAKGSIDVAKILKKASTSIVIDNKQEYSAVAQIKVFKKGFLTTYAPSVVVNIHKMKPITLKGTLQNKNFKKMTADLALNNLFKTPVTFKGDMTRLISGAKASYKSNIALRSSFLDATLKGTADKKKTNYKSNVQVQYQFNNQKAQKISFSGKFLNKSLKNLARYIINNNFQSTQFPEANYILSMNVLKKATRLENTVDLRFGKAIKSPKNKLVFSQVLSNTLKGKVRKIDHTMKFMFPCKDIKMNTKVSVTKDPRNLNTLASIEYKPKKMITLTADLKNESKKLRKYSGDISLTTPRREMRLTESLEEQAPMKFNNEMLVQWQKGSQGKMVTSFAKVGKREHTLESTLQIPNFDTISFSGRTKLFADDFNTNAELTYEGKKYSTDVNYKYEGQGKQWSGEGHFEAAHPSRRVTTDGSFRYIGGKTMQSQIEAKWDADRDENKKAGYEADYKIIGTKHEGSMKVFYPRREINAAMNVEKKGEKYTSHAEASWEAGKKMQLDTEMTFSNRGSRNFQGSTRFTSPFEKFENIFLSATHQDNGQQYNSNAEFSWAPRSKVQGTLTGKFNSLMDLDGTVSLFTPLSRSPIVLRQKHAINNKQVTSHTEFEYSNKKTVMDMSGKDDSNRWKSDIEGTFSLTTPCRYFNTVAMKFDHTMTKKMIRLSGEVSKDDKVIGATIKGVADVSSNARDVEGTFELKTPFPKVENILLSASHKDDSRKYNTDMKVRWAPRQEIAASMEMTSGMRGYSIRSNGKLEVTTPFTPYESTTLNWNHDNTETTIKHNSDLTWARRNRVVLGVDGSIETGPETKVNGMIRLQTPIRSFSDVSMKVSHSHDADNLKSELTGTYPYNKNVKLTVDLSKASDVQGAITFTSPYTNMENLAASFIHKTSRRPYTTHAEVSWTPKDKIAFDGSVNYYGLRYLTGDARLTTPFTGYESMSASINHSKRDQWSTIVEVEYLPRQKVSFEGKLNTDTPKGSITIRTPERTLRSLTASFEHSGNFPYVNTKSNVKLVGTYPASMDSFIRVSGIDSVNANIQLNLPKMDKISVDIVHRQQGSKYTTEASASAARTEAKLTSTLNIQSINNIDGAIVGTFDENEVEINFNHNGYLKNFRNHLDIAHDNKKVNLDGQFSLREMTGEFKVQSNIPKIRFASVKFNHDGDYSNFKHHAEFSFNNRKSEYDGSFTSSPNVEGKFTLKANRDITTLTFDHQGGLTRFTNNAKLTSTGAQDIEYTGFFANTNRVVGKFTFTKGPKSLNVNFNHNGDLRKFKSSAKILGNGKAVEADIEFDTAPMKGQATFNTPWTRPAAAAFNYNGEPMNFNSHAEVSYGLKKIEGDVTFSKQFGSFVLKTPFTTLSEVKSSYTIEGSLPKFQFIAHEEFSYNGGNTIAMNSEVSWMKKISTDLTTPFAAIRTLNAEVTKKGDKVHAELTHNRRNKFQTDLNLDLESFKKADLTIETPFQALESLNVAYNHEGGLRNFQSHAELTHNKRSKFEIDATSRLTSADVTIKTPFDAMRTLNMAYSHIGGLWNFNSHAELTHNQRNKFTIDASNNNFETTEFAFTTPFRTLSDAKLTLKQEGTLDDYSSNTEFTYNRVNNIKADIVFASTKNIKGSMMMTTTFPSLRDLKVAFNHAGRWNNFKSDGEITWNRRQTIAGDLEFAFSRNIKLKAGLATPYTKDLKVEFTKKGDNSDFVQHLEIAYPDMIFQQDTEFQLSPLSIKFKQVQPNFNFDGQFSHTGDYRRFQTHAEGKLNSFQPVVADLSFNMVGKIEGALKVQNQWVPVDISFNHIGSIDNFKCSGEAIVNNKKYDGQLELSNDRVTEGKLTINTPHRKLYNVEAAFNAKGNLKNMRGHAELSYNGGNKMEADASFKNYRNMQGEASIKTPFRQVREASASFNHEGDMFNFKSGAEVTYNRRNKINADVDFTTDRAIRGNAVVTTPFTNFERTAVSFNSEAKKTHGEVFAYNKKIEGDVEHTGYNNVKVEIKTPFADYENMQAAYLLEKEPTMFNVHAEVSKNNKKIEADVNTDRARGFSGKATIKTPFRGYEEMSAALDHTGGLRRFRNTATVQLSPRVKYTTFADFTLNRNIFNFVTKMSSPLNKFDANVKLEGDAHDFKSNGMVNYNGEVTSLECSYKDIYGVPSEGSIKFSCPYVEDMSMMFTNAKRGDKYNMHSELSWNPRSQIAVDGEMKYNGLNDMDASVKVMTPFRAARQFGFDLDHKNSGYNFNTRLSTEFNNEKCFSGAAGYRKVGDNNIAELTTEVPRAMSYKGSYMNTDTTTSISGEANLNSKVRGNNYKGSFVSNKEDSRRVLKSSMEARTETPYRVMSFKTEMNKSPYNLKHSAEMSWDEARNKKVSYDIDFKDRSRRSSRNYDLTAQLATPIRTMQIQGKHNDNGATFNSNADLMWDMTRDPSKKLSVRGTVETAPDTFKAEAGINTPSLPKEITLNIDNVMNQRRNILSHKTVLSYSRNPSEDWTVTGLVKVTEPTNYTADFGLTHPRSNLDIALGGHIASNRLSKSIGANMNYLDSRRQMQRVWGLGYLNDNNMRIEFYAPKVPKQMIMAAKTDDGFKVSHGFSNGKTRNAEFTMDPEAKAFDLKVNYGTEYPRDLFHMYGKYVNDKHVMVEAYRMDNNRKITEGSVSLRMNNSRLAHGRLYWRPSMYWDIKESLPTQINQLRAQIARQWEEVQADVSNEIRSKTRHVTYTLPDMSPVSDYISNEINQFNSDADTATDAAKMMFRRNEFYSRDAVDGGFAAVAYTKDMARDFSAKMDEVKRTAQAKMDQYRYMAERMYEDYARRAAYQYKLAKYNLNRKYNEYAPIAQRYIDQGYEMIAPYYQTVQTRAQRHRRDLSDLMYSITSHPQYKTSLEKISDFASQAMSHMQNMKTKAIDLKEAAKKHVKLTKAKMNNMYNDALETVNQKLDAAMGHDAVVYTKKVALNALDMAKDAADFINVKKNFHKIARDIYRNSKVVATKHAAFLTGVYKNLNKNKVTVFNPKQGEIQAQAYMPFAVKDLKTLPNIDTTNLQKLMNLSLSSLPSLPKYNPMDDYYHYKPASSNPLDWIPPFKASAFVVGAQHIKTFDGTYYEFASPCSYVLTQDFSNDNFTVVGNFEGDTKHISKKSLMIISNNKKIEIFSDFKVLVDGKKVELPVEFLNTSVTIDGERMIVKNKLGLTTEWDKANDIWSVEISGWYFGKVAGLFGTYDNEQSNDFTTSRNTVEELERFTTSWEASGACRVRGNQAREVEPQTHRHSFKTCARLFKEEVSFFRPCYKQVSPKKYFKMCVNDVEGFERNACKMAAAYIKECAAAGVPDMKMPKGCSDCNSEGKRLSDIPQSADVVLVVEERQCNKDLTGKLGALVERIEEQLRELGLSNNRFGIVGFGGEGVHNKPHTHTVGGEIMGDSRRFSFGAANLDFEEDGEFKDTLGAIEKAAHYPFRQGVSKSIVLVTCTECTQQETQYTDILNMLTTRDITLHMLADSKFESNSESKKPSVFVFGVDSKSAYSRKSLIGKKLRGDKELFSQLTVPQHICGDLTTQTEGSLFDLNRLTAGNVQAQKSFSEAFAKRVSMSAIPSGCQECSCVEGETVCKTCTAESSTLGKREENPYADEFEPAMASEEDEFKNELKEYMRRPMKMKNMRKQYRNAKRA
ncbi:unnamed protein product [Owenia fusiformis]|uniref:Uncharacterized protein n=1 Tax=Owenia fusiformis TaxID=6347 RepID=A0A8J1Y1F8_OWEFU|nr:unnamed protein product [Owenia fusiformis]